MLTLTPHFLDWALRTILLVLGSTLDALDALVRIELVDRILVALVIVTDFWRPVISPIVLKINNLFSILLQPWWHHLANGLVAIVGLWCALVRASAHICVVSILCASVVFLEFLIGRSETAKTVAEQWAECLDARLTSLTVVFLGKFTNTYLLRSTIDFWHLLLGDVWGCTVIRLLWLLVFFNL